VYILIQKEQIRRKAWHKLVNVNPYTPPPPPPTSTIPNEQEDEEYELIKRDVKRSVLFRHTTTTTTITQEVQTLHIQTIHSSIHSSKESKDKKRRRHYYQGYQDLSSIFLHIYSSTPHIATLILTTLSKFHLRDAMRDTFAVFHSVIAAMTLPILQEVDEEMHDWVESSGEEEFVYSVFLRWMVTWFAHDVHDVGIVERLFDVFLSSHPLMPLYVSIAILTHPMNRQDILQSCSDMVDDEGPTIMRIQNLVSKLKQEDKTSIGAILTPQLLIEFAVGIMSVSFLFSFRRDIYVFGIFKSLNHLCVRMFVLSFLCLLHSLLYVPTQNNLPSKGNKYHHDHSLQKQNDIMLKIHLLPSCSN